MNEHHTQLCPSPEWAEHLQQEVLPYFERQVPLGVDVLEIGPGPGAATVWLAERVTHLIAVEIEPDAARRLQQRLEETDVEVRVGDAARLAFPDESFDTVASFTMLHHVPTPTLQNQILAEALRVLRPGGHLIGSDSLASDGLHQFHGGDTYNPLEPAALLTRLQTLGFRAVTIAVDDNIKFIARKLAPVDECPETSDANAT